jgi:hypothetical protein
MMDQLPVSTFFQASGPPSGSGSIRLAASISGTLHLATPNRATGPESFC